MKDLFGVDSFANSKTEELYNKIVSGYRIYTPEQKRRMVTNNLPEFYPELPDEKFDIIYADPPW